MRSIGSPGPDGRRQACVSWCFGGLQGGQKCCVGEQVGEVLADHRGIVVVPCAMMRCVRYGGGTSFERQRNLVNVSRKYDRKPIEYGERAADHASGQIIQPLAICVFGVYRLPSSAVKLFLRSAANVFEQRRTLGADADNRGFGVRRIGRWATGALLGGLGCRAMRWHGNLGNYSCRPSGGSRRRGRSTAPAQLPKRRVDRRVVNQGGIAGVGHCFDPASLRRRWGRPSWSERPANKSI